MSNPEDTRILEVTVKADSPKMAKAIVDRICTIGAARIEDAMGFQQVNVYELGDDRSGAVQSGAHAHVCLCRCRCRGGDICNLPDYFSSGRPHQNR